MRLTVGNFPSRLSFEDRVAIGGALGFGSIPMGADLVDAYMGRNAICELKDLMKKHNMAVSTINPGVSYALEGEAWEQALQKAEERIAALGCLVTKAGFSAPNRWPKTVGEGEWDWLVAKFRAYADMLARHNVDLVFEFLGPQVGRPRPRQIMYPWVIGLDPALELIRRVDRPNVGLILDVIHWWAGTDGDYETLHKVKGLPLMLHVFDLPHGIQRDTMEDGDRCLPGEGFIDLVKWLTIVSRDGFDGDVLPEVLGSRGAELAEADSWEGPKAISKLYAELFAQVK
ncbi:MAG: sugar phosphate isomerase/epimerase family protein [Anaerolineae bacterium]|jgi:sugar phosphate isomerase/epimerase|nr:sugar phosphate isomerase/epimerase [Chloroflexota bacterium]